MAHRYPVECLIRLVEEDQSTHDVVMVLNTAGRVVFNPDPITGRRIIHFTTSEQQKEALSRNPVGEQVFVVPTDVLDEDDTRMVEEAIDRRLLAFGLITSEQYLHGPGAASEDVLAEVSKAAAKLAAEHGIDLATIQGTGADGAVLKADVQKVIDAGAAVA